jgi:hypothetical protein
MGEIETILEKETEESLLVNTTADEQARGNQQQFLKK